MSKDNFTEIEQEINRLILEYRKFHPSWSEELVISEASKMAIKYSTIKNVENAIHLEYHGCLISQNEIEEIEADLAEVGLVLSRFDKDEVAYASLEDFTLQIFLAINNPIVQSILLGVVSSAFWDGIKKSFIKIREKVKTKQSPKSKPLNCGLILKIDNSTSIQLKFDGDGAAEEMNEALDKVFDLVKTLKTNEINRNNNFFIFEKKEKKWKAVNVAEEMKRKWEQRQAKK
jgi:hypothetical protein